MTLVLDSRLYKASAVREAAGSFAELARFEIKPSRGSISVAVEDIDPEVADVLEDEFLNFALAATIESRG